MAPIPPMAIYAGMEIAKGAANYFSNRKRRKELEKMPTLEEDSAFKQYANMVRQYATEGPLSGSQQANMRRQLTAQSQPGFQMARQNIQQRAAATGLEDSAVVGQQQTEVDLARARSQADIARRIAMRNDELRLGYLAESGNLAREAFSSRQAKAREIANMRGINTFIQPASNIANMYAYSQAPLPWESQQQSEPRTYAGEDPNQRIT
tara:strand:+ start:1280 stop:1903 length:624 start_codon:yes stop_codon:yes gene_type:complete